MTIDIIKDVDFYSGALPANRNGALSSLFKFNLKQARKDKLGYKGVIGFDDIQPMGDELHFKFHGRTLPNGRNKLYCKSFIHLKFSLFIT